MKRSTYRKRILAFILLLALLPVWKGAASAEDGGMIDEDRLNAWMEEYIAQHDLGSSYQRFSVGFCYTGTGESWYYDADQWMYSASLYKVPVAMLLAEKEAAGELSQDSKVLGMPLQYWEQTALTYSNNDSGHAMVDYLGGTYAGKCSDMTIPYTDLPEDYFVEDFYQTSYYTARYITQVMTTLCAGGEERFPHVIEYLLPAQPDAYLNLSLKGRFDVAQKYGAYEEATGNKNNHVAAIIYTPTPIVVAVMTRNVGDFQARMAEVGAYLADYALELDAEIQARAEEAERLAAEEAARLE
ncbi:MAG: serine hydrolase, partial [Oscillospiraceae bacterium]|nr:serine hydrolase [Oscillospiraceae bacterium]